MRYWRRIKRQRIASYGVDRAVNRFLPVFKLLSASVFVRVCRRCCRGNCWNSRWLTASTIFIHRVRSNFHSITSYIRHIRNSITSFLFFFFCFFVFSSPLIVDSELDVSDVIVRTNATGSEKQSTRTFRRIKFRPRVKYVFSLRRARCEGEEKHGRVRDRENRSNREDAFRVDVDAGTALIGSILIIFRERGEDIRARVLRASSRVNQQTRTGVIQLH